MLNEKPNESFHWKNKLDELDNIPGESVPDKISGWEKIHERLRQKPRDNKNIWYWSAAACLLVSAGLMWFVMKPNDELIVRDKLEPKSQVSPDTTTLKESPVAKHMPVRRESKENLFVEMKQYKSSPQPTDNALTHEHVAKDSVEVREPLPDLTVNSIKPDDTIAIIAAAPGKKKLPIVHINELSKPVAEEIQLARNHSIPILKTNLFNQDAFSNFGVSRTSADNILKIKLSPSN